MSAVCPKCGVAVVPGYVKCPKCHATLPQRKTQPQPAGGTAMEGRTLSLPAILTTVAVIGAIAVFALRRGEDKPTIAPDVNRTPDETQPVERRATPDPEVVTPTPQTAAIDPAVAVRDLDRALKKERLWGTIEVVGSRVDVRSGACADAAMMPVVEAAIPALRDGGVAKVRCLAQAGALVFERDL